MNIFFLDTDIDKNVLYHVDKHVVKMRVELAQLACTTHHVLGTNPDIIPYKKTHVNHPCAIWTRESLKNYLYVVNLGLKLCDELEFRFKTQNQKTRDTLNWCYNNIPRFNHIDYTVPRLAMDNKFKIVETNNIYDTVVNYRNYYKQGKTHLFKWTNREVPKWIKL
jgi:hypothetical protein